MQPPKAPGGGTDRGGSAGGGIDWPPGLADFVVSSRPNQEFDTDKTDPAFSALYRQVIFFGAHKKVRLSTEVAYRDTALKNLALGPNLTALGG